MSPARVTSSAANRAAGLDQAGQVVVDQVAVGDPAEAFKRVPVPGLVDVVTTRGEHVFEMASSPTDCR